ncbi:hypothetical protein D3C87_78390 [compost metagenome]
MYFYEEKSIVDNYKFTTYDDFSASKKAERIFKLIAYTKCALYRDYKKIDEFTKKD